MKFHFEPIHPSTYRKYTLWVVLATAFAVLATAAAFSARESIPTNAAYTERDGNPSAYYSSNEMASQGNEPSSSANSRTFKNSEPIYIIRAYENAVAIFEEGSSRPLYTIDTPLDRLTQADQELLRAGIRTDTLAAAYKLIEDYE